MVPRLEGQFPKMLPGLNGLSYRKRLSRLGLYSFEHRRTRGDVIEV